MQLLGHVFTVIDGQPKHKCAKIKKIELVLKIIWMLKKKFNNPIPKLLLAQLLLKDNYPLLTQLLLNKNKQILT